jgi:hypothetical protein
VTDSRDIHPRTWSEIKPGVPVVIRDASGKLHQRTAATGVTRGDRFLVIWVSRAEEIAAATREHREPEAVPWPAEDVWVPGCEPRDTDDPRRLAEELADRDKEQ